MTGATAICRPASSRAEQGLQGAAPGRLKTITPLNTKPFEARPSAGILLLLTALCFFTALDTLAKKLTETNPVMMVVWARYFFHVTLMVLLLGPRWGMRLVRTRRPRLQLLRGLFLGTSSIFFFSSLSLMPLAEASSITMTAPIILSALAVAFLKEKPPRGTWLALGISMAGVLLIIRPGTAVFNWAMLMPLVTAFCFAGYQYCTRLLADSDEGITTLFLGAVAATVLICMVVPLYWKWPERAIDVAGFVVMGAIGAYGHSLLIRAYRHANATRLAPFLYMQMVVSLLFGWLAFGHFPDAMALTGMAVVTCSGLLLTLARSRQA